MFIRIQKETAAFLTENCRFFLAESEGFEPSIQVYARILA